MKSFPPLCQRLLGSFNPFSDDPLPAYPKKQLVLKIISGQQLPKPPDSMLGDRGEVQQTRQNTCNEHLLLFLNPNMIQHHSSPCKLTRNAAAFSSIRSLIHSLRWRSSVCLSTAARSRPELWMTTVCGH